MSKAEQWLRDAAQRVAEHSDGTWCSKSWRIIADAFELVGDDPDGKLDLVAIIFDEIATLRQRLAAASAAARFYARYYDGPAESLLGEEDRKAFQWVEENGGET